jgi:hypothetical protein
MALQYQFLRMEEFFKEIIMTDIFVVWDISYLLMEIFMLDILKME